MEFTMRDSQTCDCCINTMPDKMFEKNIKCDCDICGPWVLCDGCHKELRKTRLAKK